jgi:hypothetical protein
MKKVEVLSLLFLTIFISFFLLPKTANSQTVKSFDEYSTELKSVKSVGATSAENLNKLYFEFNPGLVVTNTNVKETSVSTPVVIDVNISEVAGLYKRNKKFETVEMIKINVDSPSSLSALDLGKLSGFSSLKYIVFQCGFQCNADYVKNNLIAGRSVENHTILYLVSIPE